ncbi:MAG: hypothetical protein ACXVLK_10050, partial [Acidimicrobiales bacterium]
MHRRFLLGGVRLVVDHLAQQLAVGLVVGDRDATHPLVDLALEPVELVETPIPELADGEALMRTIYLGMDATVRTWLNRGEGYLPAVEI